MGKTVPQSQQNSRGYRMSAVDFPSFHTELLTKGRATPSLQKCLCQMILGISVEALQRMPKELEHECENGHFSLIICLWYAWKVILSLQHFIWFLNFPFLRNLHFAQPCSWQRHPAPIPRETHLDSHHGRAGAKLMLPKYHQYSDWFQEGTKELWLTICHVPLERLKLLFLDSLSIGCLTAQYLQPWKCPRPSCMRLESNLG